jgi:predicted outer membrane repeat protein
MGFSFWLRNPFGSNPGERRRMHGVARQRATFRPRLEALEERWLPSQVSLVVTSLADTAPGAPPGTGTLRAAIQTANAGSPSDKFTIGFSVTGTIDLQNPLELQNSIAIHGPGESSLTVERAATATFIGPTFTVDAGQSASISGLTIANGNGGIVNGGTLTVSSCTLTGNFAGRVGGGAIDNGASLTVSHCTFSGNSTNFAGGAIFSGGTLTVTDSTLTGNYGGMAGGGIFNGVGGTASISGCTLSSNSASSGGGIANAIFGSGAMTVSGCTLAGNSASEGGGIANGSFMTVRDSTLTGNSASEGGGIFNSPFELVTVIDCTLSRNSAFAGGGIFNGVGGTLVVRGSTFCSNTASDGGGIFNFGAATLQECTLSYNSATSAGGGIYNNEFGAGSLTIDDSYVCGNVAPVGADLYTLGFVTLNDSTVGVIGP